MESRLITVNYYQQYAAAQSRIKCVYVENQFFVWLGVIWKINQLTTTTRGRGSPPCDSVLGLAAEDLDVFAGMGVKVDLR